MSGSQLINRVRPSKSVLLGIVAVLAAYNFYQNLPDPVPSPIVQISTGSIQGIVSKSRDGKEFFEFRGIPYAKAPVGDLRFEVPEPAVPWQGIRDASNYEPDCIQVNPIFKDTIAGKEDCLFLNVFSPKVGPKGISENPLPVMVFYHGGYFMSGSATSHKPNYIMDEYVILVTVNYRLASFGFLNTADGVVRGNMGLKDQNMALKWVQQNIAKFGGDSSKVTIFGESAGAGSVHFHMLSKMSKGLFHRAISQSGTAIKVWGTQLEPRKQALRLIELLNCTKTTTKESIRCLKGVKAEAIAEIHKESSNPILDNFRSYKPSIENFAKDSKDTFITEDPKKIISEGRGNNVPWIIGLNSGEGLLYSARIMHKKELTTEFESNFDTIFPQVLVYDKNNTEITKKLRNYYFDADKNEGKADYNTNFAQYTNLFSDRYYNCPIRNSALLQAKYSPVYLYYNDYSTDFTLFDFISLRGHLPVMVEIIWKLVSNWFQKNILRSQPVRFGVCHGDELSLLFPFPTAEVTHNSKDFAMSKALVKLWVQFAYDDTEMEFGDVRWTPISPTTNKLKYLQFSNDRKNNKFVDEPFGERIKFWESLNLPN